MESEKTEKMKEYRDAVEFLAEHEVNSVMLNSGNEHATIIFQNIFSNSKNHIKILAGNLHNDVTESPEYIAGLVKFLQLRNSKLDIMLDRFDGTQKSMLFEKLFLYKEKINIKSTNTEFYFSKANEKEESTKNPVHFCIGDKRMYRLETDTKQRSARCNFNDSEYVSKLDGLFSKAFEKGETIDWYQLVNKGHLMK
ncbi:hypothetical protein AGMMS49525_00590 [Bacteroidia bacterium]|nr:hypothetical protein AGMMS49525_00590 [Bacteroidia bacterium]